MRYFKHEVSENKATIYPFVCWHLGAEQSDEKFIKEMIYTVKHDDSAKWIYLGDGGENAIAHSKGDVYSQTMSPQEQVNELHALLRPIREKGLFLLKGNHGNRTYKETGISPDEMLGLALQLPYLGTSAFMHLKVNRSLYSVFLHHGGDSGVSIASKVNAAKKPEATVNADAIITAHSHVLMELPPVYRVRLDASRKEPVVWDTTYEYIAGSAYDSRSGYAEDKMYPPIIPSHLGLEFSGKIVEGTPQKKITSKLYRAEA